MSLKGNAQGRFNVLESRLKHPWLPFSHKTAQLDSEAPYLPSQSHSGATFGRPMLDHRVIKDS